MRKVGLLLCSAFLVALFGLPNNSGAARRVYEVDMRGHVPRGRLAAAASTVLVFREPHRGSTEKFVDLFPLVSRRHPGFSPGDELLFTNRLERRGRRVGRIHVICTATQRGRNPIRAGFMCNILANVPGGTLVMVSPYAERGNSNGREGAVVGGTGRYAGARGTFDDEQGRRFDTNTIRLLE
jgi:hypothetical protein